MKEDHDLLAGKSSPPESDRNIDGVTAADEHKDDRRKMANLSTANHSEETAEQSSRKLSGSENGEDEEDRVIKELKKVQRQNFLTQCLVSAMIVLTVTWQLSEVSMILKVKEGLNHPFRAMGGFITKIFKRHSKPIINATTEDENPATRKQKQGVDASSLLDKIPDFSHLELPSIDFITLDK